MAERMSIYWHDALCTEANKVFPGIRHANAGRYVWRTSTRISSSQLSEILFPTRTGRGKVQEFSRTLSERIVAQTRNTAL